MKEIINSIRNQVQEQTVELWGKSNYSGYALISMGVGKSKIIADGINKIMSTDKKDSILKCKLPIVILVNSVYLRDKETPRELKIWGCNHKIKYACYATAYRWKDKDIGLLIADEMDYAITEKESYSKAFTQNSYKYFLGLTGCMVPDKYVKSVEIFSSYPFFSFPLREAHRLNILNKLKIWMHEVPLSPNRSQKAPYGEISQYKYIQKRIDQCKEIISQKYDELRSISNYSDDTSEIEEEILRQKNFKRYWESSPKNTNSRMSMMRSADSLIEYAIKLKENILSTNNDNKVLIFGQLTKDVDRVTPNGYHGKNPDQNLITKFNNGDIREMGAVKKVSRGVNFVGLNNCIVQSYSSSLTEAQQAYVGRMVRLPVDQVGHIHFLVSYYIQGDQKVYCHNANWLSDIVYDIELKHIDKQITVQQ